MSLEMRSDDRVPVVVAHLEEKVVADDSRARDQHVERAAVRDRRLRRGLDLLELRHVAANRMTADLLRSLLGAALVEVRDDDRRALRGEPLRSCGADALRAARHQHRLALESRHGRRRYTVRAWSSATSSRAAGCIARSCLTRSPRTRSTGSPT